MTPQLKERFRRLELLKARVARLERQLTYELALENSRIPEEYGFATAKEFLKAVTR
jgi:hypothetical protein